MESPGWEYSVSNDSSRLSKSAGVVGKMFQQMKDVQMREAEAYQSRTLGNGLLVVLLAFPNDK